jgi:transposase, IS5 family
MTQMTFAELEYQNKKRKTRREVFLEKMDQLIPWGKLEETLVKYRPAKATGRPGYPLSVMLRIHCMQLFYNLSDPAMEDALYEIESMRRFAGLTLSDSLPDESTILLFRHFLEQHKLGSLILDSINQHLARQGMMLREGTIVDATIINAPSSTKNKAAERDPEMHQTKKGNEWKFGMKMHIGVDEALGLVRSVATTAANVHDLTPANQLLHGEEKRVFADAGYQGIHKRKEHLNRAVDWYVAIRKMLDKSSPEARQQTLQASIRAKVEHPFKVIKQVFGYSKARYRGLLKNTERLMILAGFANLLRVQGALLG